MSSAMRSRVALVAVALVVTGCGAVPERTRDAAQACDVRLPTAKERAAAKPLERKFARFERAAERTLRRLKARDDGSRAIAADVLEKGMRARRAEGLDASEVATRAVILAAPGVSEESGFPLTDTEFDLLYIRSDIGHHTRLAVQYVRKCLRGQSGGLYYGGDARGQFIALPLTTGSSSARAEVAKRAAIDRSFLRVPRVRYTAAELTAAKERISDELFKEPDFRTVAPDISGNRVELTIEPYTEERAAELKQRFGDILHVAPGSRIEFK